MKEKNNIKDIFENTFNIEKNHEEILSKIEKNPKKNSKPSTDINIIYILAPITCILLLFLTINITTKTENSYQGNNNNNNRKIKNVIKYNTLTNVNSKHYDIDGRLEKIKEEEILKIYPYLKNINFLNDSNTYIEYNNFYSSSNPKNISLYNKKLGHFIRISNETTDKYIIMFLSETEKQFRRCYRIDLDSLEDSTINNQKVKLIKKSENEYIAIFSFKGTYFDIELTNIKEQELIKIITSITKEQ